MPIVFAFVGLPDQADACKTTLLSTIQGALQLAPVDLGLRLYLFDEVKAQGRRSDAGDKLEFMPRERGRDAGILASSSKQYFPFLGVSLLVFPS